MFSSSKRIFLAYSLIIALLGGYAWRLHTGQLERSKRYENCLGIQDYTLKLLERDLDYRYSQLANRSDFMGDSLYEVKLANSKRVKFFCEEQLGAIAILIGHLYPNGYTSDAEIGWNNTDDTRSEIMLRRMASMGDSLQMLCADKPRALELVNQHFSKTHLERIADVMLRGTRAEKAVALSELRFGILAVTLRVMRALAEPFPREKTAYLPVFNAENKVVHAGEVFSGELFGVSSLPELTNRRILINQKPIPVENGVGKFMTSYTKAGTQKFVVEIWDTSPVSGKVDSYLKAFTLEIHP